jgi:cellobiose phosphorylase
METQSASGTKALAELFHTKYGHFRADGLAYVITRHDTPRPWINILCNGAYGLIVSQTGGGYSWWENANLARLTSWTQDVIRDEAGKFLYIRDDDSGEVWSASYKPVGAAYERYEVEHAVGSTTFTQRRQGLETRWTLVVPPTDAVEIWRVQLHNLCDRPRRVSLFSYVEWCLGNGLDWHREFQKTFIETLFDEKLNALIGIKRRLAMPAHISTGMTEWPLAGFHTVNRPVASYDGDKERFLGRYRGLHQPEAVQQGRLSNTTGRWNDSIGSLHVQITLAPRALEEVIFLLGKHESPEATETIIRAYGSPQGCEQALQAVRRQWEPFLNRLRVETPDPAFDLMTNVWLKYQAICGRIWARTAFYQSSAAYGFRDQLQDSQVFLPLAPELTKRQILLHGAHQFLDGAVMHWWLPLLETGPKSEQSDTPLWLVYLTLSYLAETDDYGILLERAPYRDGAPKPLFDHCTRAIERVLPRVSRRGLPLIGHGDWNDGFSAVGLQWKGESPWMAHFLYDVLTRWAAALERLRTDAAVKRPAGLTNARLSALMRRYRARAESTKRALNKHCWDGQWYWGASRDDGRLIGSKRNAECRIYLNTQTWAVIAGTATPDRLRAAMASVEKHLDREYGPLLLTPAFTRPDPSIGYITRYAPGTRENGGVYSHAAVWAILAECMLGRAERAYQMYAKICPPKRGMDPELYYGEPYVMPGNSDGPESPWFGRAGWTWYTGSAAWLFRVSTEWILGIRATPEGLKVDPCIPAKWEGFRMVRAFRGTTYQISVENPRHVSQGVKEVWVDGAPIKGDLLTPRRDGQVHQVRVVMG